MSIDQQTAAALGFPKLKYAFVERERRWLCREVPRDRVVESDAVTDLYVDNARLRLREARPLGGGPPMLRLTRKVDVDAHTRLLTSIYLPESEFAMLARALSGERLKKIRHRLRPVGGITVLVDEFQDRLAGLVTAEAEFETMEQLRAFPTPDFALREVTEDSRYGGGYLSKNGIPKD